MTAVFRGSLSAKKNIGAACHMLARLCLDAEYRTTARVCLRVWEHAYVAILIALVGSCTKACTTTIRLSLGQTTACIATTPFLFPGGAAMMDCNAHVPRLAFGHLDQDGCIEEGGLAVDVVVTAASEDQRCSSALKERISSALSVPESDQVLLLSNGQSLGAKRRLWSRRRQ